MEDLPARLALRIAKLREAQGLTQRAMAKKMGVTQQALSLLLEEPDVRGGLVQFAVRLLDCRERRFQRGEQGFRLMQTIAVVPPAETALCRVQLDRQFPLRGVVDELADGLGPLQVVHLALQQLAAIVRGEVAGFDPELAARFARLNREHLRFENECVLPLAARALSPADLERLGRAMAARRGVAYPA